MASRIERLFPDSQSFRTSYWTATTERPAGKSPRHALIVPNAKCFAMGAMSAQQDFLAGMERAVDPAGTVLPAIIFRRTLRVNMPQLFALLTVTQVASLHIRSTGFTLCPKHYFVEHGEFIHTPVRNLNIAIVTLLV